ncbi:CHAP domain-containing protein [Streptomyces sp. KhCrAH-43]|uniref:CHAP domain-containing protein n=1 Tax=unclassified Streptomyces TaxID=2593676 RepID=UPI0003811AFE|nr:MULTISPECIES: CHAP domain-containing protein [unclassified Streptomyces]RAJ53814.1 CHAP domain-containing protein [Streptomyces sp. KhCrAH-43]
MTGTAADVTRVLNGEVGYREGFSGGHWNNKQKYSSQVPGLEWSDYQAWCCTFTSWTFQEAGLPKGTYPVTASCLTATNWWKQQGRWSEYPAIGAQVMFGPGGGSHTGIVIDYDADTITTIEGNTNTSGSAEGDGVYRKTRKRRDSYVYGYGYPAYPGGIKSADPNWKNPTTAPTKEDDMPTAADVWKADVIPAAAPPYNNKDYDKNKQWKASYALGEAVLTGRKNEAKLDALTKQVTALVKKVDAVSVGGIDLDALANRVADLLAARLAK